jgi:hypothetical protein
MTCHASARDNLAEQYRATMDAVISGEIEDAGLALIGERMAEVIRNTVTAWMHKPCNALGMLGSYDTQAGPALRRVCFLDVVRASVCE